MDRRQFLAAGGAAVGVAASFPGCAAPSSDGSPPGLRNPSFEGGLNYWTVGRDLPIDPNTGLPVAAAARVTDERASRGTHSVALSIDGRQDDGTLWVQQPADLGRAERVLFDVYSPEESFNTITKVAVYAGPRPDEPLAEGRFDTDRPVEDHAGWKTYEYPVASAEDGLVAAGVAVVWETEVTRWVDHVRLK